MPPGRWNRKRGPRPLAPAPLRSLKRARRVTTTFHRLSRALATAEAGGDAAAVARIREELQVAGGREAYQRASQVSTAAHSTSRWVLAHLVRNRWIRGRPVASESACARVASKSDDDDDNDDDSDSASGDKGRTVEANPRRRPTHLLEVGAINAQLLDAGRRSNGSLIVRAIDLRSSHADIEEADFLQLPLEANSGLYDVIVCSMVLNCVNTPEERGAMIRRLHRFTSNDGLVFVVIPKSCLTMSPYMNEPTFIELLETVGLAVVETKSSPKLSFFVLCHQSPTPAPSKELHARFASIRTIRHGKSHLLKNDFSVVLTEDVCSTQP